MERPSGDPAVEDVFTQLRTRRRPELDREDREAFFAWVLVRQKGIELGFVDEVYYRAGESLKRRRKGVPLILWQVYFYSKRDDISDFPGKLPFGIEWSDNRDQVRQRLSQFESTRRSYLRDVWNITPYRMTVDYKGAGDSVDSVICFLEAKPWPESGRVLPQVRFLDWVELLRHHTSSPFLHERLSPLDLAKQLAEGGGHEVDFRIECGLQLTFVQSKNLKRTDSMPVRKEGKVLGAVRFYRSRELDAREWRGEMPFGITFDDTQGEILDKVGRAPDEQSDETLAGYMKWHFPEFSLHVLYSNLKNWPLRVTLSAPGF